MKVDPAVLDMEKHKENKAIYIRWAKQHAALSLFLRPWWLDLTAGAGNWEVALVPDGDNGLLAALPYSIFRKKGVLVFVENPLLTPYTGPYINYPPGLKRERRYHLEKKAVGELIRQLPPRAHFIRLKCQKGFTNCLPFHWAGFQCEVRYTYHLSLRNLEAMFRECSSNIRRNIKKAEGIVHLEENRPAAEFYQVHSTTFIRQAMKVPYSRQFFLNMDRVLDERKQGKKFFAVDQAGKVHATLYLTWDEHASYYLLGGVDPEYRWSGAGHWLMWEAICYSKDVLGVQTFDFLGSMIESVEDVRRQFGAVQQPFYCVRKAKSIWLDILSRILR